MPFGSRARGVRIHVIYRKTGIAMIGTRYLAIRSFTLATRNKTRSIWAEEGNAAFPSKSRMTHHIVVIVNSRATLVTGKDLE